MRVTHVLLFALVLSPHLVRGASAPIRGGESDAIEERVRFYAERHGLKGKADSELRRKRVAEEYAARLVEEKGRNPLIVGGSQWIFLGPSNGAGRVNSLAPHPTIAGTVYAGSAGGGVWRTTDGGATWTPLTDFINDLAVGAIAIAPSSPNIIYLGSGEAAGSSAGSGGIGLLKSTDGGASWAIPASVVASSFFAISVHPSNAQDLLIGTWDGTFRSTDGGTTWSSVVDSTVYGDVTDIVRDSLAPQVIYGACRSTSAQPSTVLKSTDDGVTWVDTQAAFPPSSRVAVAISPSSPSVLYAAAENGSTSYIHKTTDAGQSWANLSALSGNSEYTIRSYLGGQGWYDNTIVVSPTDPNVVVAGGIFYVRSSDGGATFASASGPHVDAHDLRYQGAALWLANDGGVYKSTDGGANFTDRSAGLNCRQYYTLALDPVHRNRVLGGTQDNGTDERPDTGGSSWMNIDSGDGFDCAVNPSLPSIAYATAYPGNIRRTMRAGDGSYFDEDVSPPHLSSEFAFSTNLVMDPATPATLYTNSGSRIWRSTDAGDSWMPLPTETTDGSVFYPGPIAIARSNPAVLMTNGSNGTPNVLRSTNGGLTWTTSSAGLPFGVTHLEIDPVNASIAYAAVASWTGQSIYRTVNGGTSWGLRSTGLPLFPALVVRVDPTDSNVLYCGTAVGVYRSTDQGLNWARFGTGLPNSSVNDLRILDDGSMLRVATHGRGIWELQVPPTGNTPPSATIAGFASSITVAQGAVVAFRGSVSDPDPGDSVTGTWNFADTWESQAFAGPSAVQHTFARPGVFPVSLTARDSHGALGNGMVTVSVVPPQDSCGFPRVIPGAGPFPFSLWANDESSTRSEPVFLGTCILPINQSSSLWFEFTPTVGGTYEFSADILSESGFNRCLSLYSGPACGPYETLACYTSAFFSVGGSAAIAAGQTVRILTTNSPPFGPFGLTVRPVSGPVSAPRLESVTPFHGATSGGSGVTLSGDGFVSGSQVSFGGAPAAAVTYLRPKSLFATTPAHSAAIVDVSVTNPDGTMGTLGGGFTFQDGFTKVAQNKLYTLAPCRLLDTRAGTGPLAGPALQPWESRVFALLAAPCGVPSDALAVSVNATVTQPGASGSLALFPGGTTESLATTTSFGPGRTQANNAIIGLAADGSGTVLVVNRSGSTVHFILDVNAYFR